MKILITGICGFAGTAIAEALLERREDLTISGIDNLHRPGSEINRMRLRKRGVKFVQGDIRQASDFEVLPAADWVIDAAANPSVLAGRSGNVSSRQLFVSIAMRQRCAARDATAIDAWFGVIDASRASSHSARLTG